MIAWLKKLCYNIYTKGINTQNMSKKTLVIAEIGTAHQGNLQKAKQLVKAACESGADCIKFQWVYADEILHPKTGDVTLPGGTIPLYEKFRQLEVSKKFFSDIQSYVRSFGKKFMCSPFGMRSLEELFSIKPDYIKIASPELNHIPLLQRLLELEMSLPEQKRIPVVLSSGVSTLEDIRKSITLLAPLANAQLVTLLHCVTSYPAPVQDYNVEVLPFLKSTFKVPVGVSDHSLDPILVPLLSVSCGATMIEKHITLSNDTDGLDDPVALEAHSFLRMSEAIRMYEHFDKNTIINILKCSYDDKTILSTLGSGKKELAKSEQKNYGRTNRSIHFMRDMKKGETITKKDIAILRTERILSVGIEPCYFDEVLNKTLSQDANDGDGLAWKHIAS